MKDFKGTKGEWVYTTRMRPTANFQVFKDFDHTKGKQICEISFISDEEEMRANAQLIAAAPDLLNALQGLWKDTKENGGLPPEDVEYIDNEFGVTKAINKALGSTSLRPFHCPNCKQPWDTRLANSCQCGASVKRS